MATLLKILLSVTYGSIMVIQNPHSVMLYVHSLSCCSIELNLKSWAGSVTQILKKDNKNICAVDAFKCIVALL